MRTYPYLISRNELILTVHQCEACNKLANYSIKYEPNESAIEMSHIFLCSDHEKLAKYGNWTQVFKDMNSKVGVKNEKNSNDSEFDVVRGTSVYVPNKAGDRR